MAKLFSKGQRLVAGVTNPVAVYSRLVTCSHYGVAPPGQDFAYTETLGQVLRLLSVDVWLDTNPPTDAHLFTFSVWRMNQAPADRMAMYRQENILPVRANVGIWYWHKYGPEGHFHWDMDRTYKGIGQRFGVVMTGAGAPQFQIHASFKISEG